MSRLISPRTAAKHAERVATEAAQLRKEKRNSWLMIIGVALASMSLMAGNYIWLRARARGRRDEHLQRQQERGQPNSPAVTIPDGGKKNSTETPGAAGEIKTEVRPNPPGYST